MLIDLVIRKFVQWANILNKPSSTVADIDDAVDKKHTQNTDTILNNGGANQVSASQLKSHINNAPIHREINYDEDYKAYLVNNS